jgi:hypothetical protein
MPARRVTQKVTLYPLGSQKAVAEAKGVAGAAYDAAARRLDFTVGIDAPRPSTVLLRKWQMAPLDGEIEPGYDASRWTPSPRPRALGSGPYGWYRTNIRSQRDGTRTLILKNAADSVTVFLNGKYLGQSPTKQLMDAPRAYASPLTFQAPLQKGDNCLAVLVKNWGRYRLAATYDKPLAEVSGWGLLDDVTVDGSFIADWRRRDGLSPEGRSLRWAEIAKLPCPVRWYRCDFKIRPSPSRPVARAVLRGLRHGALWINGRYAGLYLNRGFDTGHGCYLPPDWLKPNNTLIVLEEGGTQPDEAELRFDRDACHVPFPISLQ